MTKSGVVHDLVSISGSIPPAPTPELHRESTLSTLNSLFNTDYQTVFLVGPPRSGKTHVLRQFVLQNSKTALNYFVDLTVQPTFNLHSFVVDIVGQLRFSSGKLGRTRDDLTVESVLELFPIAAQKARQSGSNELYVVIDGLFDLGQDCTQIIDSIYKLLPASLKPIKYLFSCSEQNLPLAKRYKPEAFVQAISPLLSHEVDFFLGNSKEQPEADQLREIIKEDISVAHAISSLLHSGVKPEEITGLDSPELNSLLQIEFDRILTIVRDFAGLAPVLAFVPGKLDSEALSTIAGVSPESVVEVVEQSNYLTLVDNGKSKLVAITQSIFQDFLRSKFKSEKNQIIDRILSYLKQQSKDTSLQLELLQEKKDWDGILELADMSYLRTSIQDSQSILTSNSLFELLQHASEEAKQTETALFCLLTSSALLELIRCGGSSEATQILLSVMGSDEAWKHAQGIYAVEERLIALSQIVKYKRKKNEDVSDFEIAELESCIEALPSELPDEEGIEIASNLVYADKAMGIQILQKIRSNSGKGDALDWLITKCFMEAVERGHNPAADNTLTELVESNSSESKVAELLASLLNFSGNKSDFRKQLAGLRNDEDRVLLCRSYVKSSARTESRIAIAIEAVELCISSGSYQPNAKVYADLAYLLTTSKVSDELTLLYRKIHSQIENVIRIGPTPEAYQVKILLCIYQARIEEKSGVDYIYSILDELLGHITEPDSALDICVRLLTGINELEEAEKGDWVALKQLVEECRRDFENKVFSELAYQAKALTPSFKELLLRRDIRAIELLAKINTSDEKYELLSNAIRSIASDGKNKLINVELLSFLQQIIYTIDREHLRSNLFSLLAKLCISQLEDAGDNETNIADAVISEVKTFLLEVSSPLNRLCGAAQALRAISSLKLSEICVPALKKIFEEASKIVAPLYGKGDLVLFSAEFYSEYIAESSELKDMPEKLGGLLKARALNEVIPFYCTLMAKCYGWIPFKGLDYDRGAVNFFREMLSKVDSHYVKVSCWVQLGMEALGNNPARAQDIAEKSVIPSLFEFSGDSPLKCHARASLLEVAGPLLWKTNREVFRKELGGCSRSAVGTICCAVLSYILKGNYRGSPENKGYKKGLTYSDVSEVVELLEISQADGLVFHIVFQLAKADRDTRCIQRLPSKQRLDILDRVQERLSTALPDPMGLNHEGYQIASNLIMRLAILQHKLSINSIKDQVERIPNISDRSFVYSVCLSITPRSRTNLRGELRDVAVEAITRVKSAAERLGRSDFLVGETGSDCKKAVESRLVEWLSSETVDERSVTRGGSARRLVNTLYRVDPEWASLIASKLEQKSMSRDFSEFLQDSKIIEAKKDGIFQGADEGGDHKSLTVLCDLYWDSIGLIRRGEGSVMVSRDFCSDFRAARGRRLLEVFPIICAVSLFLVRRFPIDIVQAKSSELFERFNQSFEFLMLVSGEGSNMPFKYFYKDADEDSDEKFFDDSDPDAPIRFIRQWISDQRTEKLIIADGYLEAEVFEIVRAAQNANPLVEISLLTGLKFLKRFFSDDGVSSSFRAEWRSRYDDEPLPFLKLIVPFFAKDDRNVIHDRWILSDAGALKLGSSLNGLVQSETSISIVRDASGERARNVMEGYLKTAVEEKGGKRVFYELRQISQG